MNKEEQEEISSPLSAQILEFCESELFPETLQNSEVASSSNCCYEEHSSYPTNLSLSPDINKFTTTGANAAGFTSAANNNNSNLSIIFDSPDDLQTDISASIDFTSSPPFTMNPQFLHTQNDQFDNYPPLQNPIQAAENIGIGALTQYAADPISQINLIDQTPLPAVYEDECLPSVTSYVRMNPSSSSCSFLDPSMGSYFPGNLNHPLSAENSGIFNGSLFFGAEVLPPHQELEFQGDNGGIFCPEPLPRVYSSGEFQALSNESQHMVNGPVGSTPLTSDISSLEDSTFKVGKLSVEQRKEKIHRYMKKRNERNFSKKIKYACRKTLADSRPRVRGRFAKNDEFGEATRTTCSNHEEDTDDDAVVREEEEMVDSSDIFAHISGVNSFKCNYSIQSWI